MRFTVNVGLVPQERHWCDNPDCPHWCTRVGVEIKVRNENGEFCSDGCAGQRSQMEEDEWRQTDAVELLKGAAGVEEADDVEDAEVQEASLN